MNETVITSKKVISYQLEDFQVKVFHFEQIDSTNTFLKKYFHYEKEKNIAPVLLEGVGALADLQTAGRGRMQRTWHSPVGEGLYFSLLLTPKIDVAKLTLISLMAAVATAEAIETFCPVKIDIKWPNDILINNKKSAGILIESGFEANSLSYVIIGIGVNLQQKTFPNDLNRPATSLFLETGLLIETQTFLPVLLKSLIKWYKVFRVASDKITYRWQELSSYAYGKKIEVILNGEQLSGVTMGLNEFGALQIKTKEGKQIVLYGNEITAEE